MNKIQSAQLFDLEIKGDERGSLVALENNKNIPFEIQRVYYIFNTKENVRRGFHAHRSLSQFLVCTNGSCKILIDDGINKHIIELSDSKRGLYIRGLIWHEMFDFSPDCVLMVLADDYYNESDYIRDYPSFLRLVKDYHVSEPTDLL